MILYGSEGWTNNKRQVQMSPPRVIATLCKKKILGIHVIRRWQIGKSRRGQETTISVMKLGEEMEMVEARVHNAAYEKSLCCPKTQSETSLCWPKTEYEIYLCWSKTEYLRTQGDPKTYQEKLGEWWVTKRWQKWVKSINKLKYFRREGEEGKHRISNFYIKGGLSR